MQLHFPAETGGYETAKSSRNSLRWTFAALCNSSSNRTSAINEENKKKKEYTGS